MRSKLFITSVSLLALTACAVGPDYVRPDVSTPAVYKEAGPWKLAEPADEVDRGAWWRVYNDPTLDQLEQRVDVSNQNLKAAEAAYRAAVGTVKETQSSLFPTIGLNAGATNGAKAGRKPTTSYDLTASGSWSLDVWGRIRRSIESDESKAEATAADLASARLSAQAELATDYFSLRSQDELKRLLNAIVAADQKALQIVTNQYNAGIAAKADVLAAQTQFESVQALAVNADLKRAQYEHAIAVLVGSTPADFTLAPEPFNLKLPNIPAETPSLLLQRRPDIASAERLVEAANAEIGIATAAWFPDLTLSASYGYASAVLSKLIQTSTNVWSVGPTLAVTLLDFGARSAAVDRAHANYDQSVAQYRQTVLTAFQQVEDNLAALRILTDQAKIENAAVRDARHSEALTLNQYKEGIVPYNNVLTAQTTRLNNEQSALTVTLNRLTASVALIQAMGGSWNGHLDGKH